MDSLSFPIKMVEGAEPKIARADRGAPYTSQSNDQSGVGDSNDSREDTFSDHMHKEPENNERRQKNVDGSAIQERDNEDVRTKAHGEPADNAETLNDAGVTRTITHDRTITDDMDTVPAAIRFGESIFGPPVDQAQKEIPIATPVGGKNPDHEAAKARLIEIAQSRRSLSETRFLTRRTHSDDHETKGKPITRDVMTMPMTAGSTKASEIAVPGMIALDPTLEQTLQSMFEGQTGQRRMDLKVGEYKIIDKPEPYMGNAAKPAINPATPILPSTYMYVDGEPEIDIKAFASSQDAAATSRLVLSLSSMSTSAATATPQTTNAAATAAAQVIAAIKADKNSNIIEVRLDPPELGRVRISFNMETADAVKAVLNVERAETLDHLRRNSSQFMEDLKLAGFGSVDIEFAEHGTSDFSQDSEFEDFDSDPSFISTQESTNDIVYLSLRDDAQLNLLV